MIATNSMRFGSTAFLPCVTSIGPLTKVPASGEQIVEASHGCLIADVHPSFMRVSPGASTGGGSTALLDSRREPRVSAWLHKLLRKKGRGHKTNG